jgi:hypothetical protein
VKIDADKTAFCYERQPFSAGIKSLRATLPAGIFYWGFLFLKDSVRDVFISRLALKGRSINLTLN